MFLETVSRVKSKIARAGLSGVVESSQRNVSEITRALFFSAQAQQHSADRLEDSVDFALKGLGGLIRPLQVRSEVLGLMKEVAVRRPLRMLEIGTCLGGTLFLHSRVCADDALIISLDLPGGNFGGGYAPWKKKLYSRFARGTQKIELLRMSSHDQSTFEVVKNILKGEKLDYLFIDGDHTYEGVKQDFELYSPLVKKGGLIAMHDILAHATDLACQVHRYWPELQQTHACEELIENRNQGWGGIGLVRLK